MIDRELVSEHLSLLPGQERPALTMKIHFDWNGRPGNGSAERGSFVSLAKLSYRDFEDLLHPDTEPVARHFANDATALASALFRKRVAIAGMPEWECAFDMEGRLNGNLRQGVLAQTVLHELMVALNAAATRLVTSLGMPMIYRNQGGGAAGRGGRYQGNNEGHAALGLDAYGQFMSGIRRYVDLVNQRVLIAAIEGTCAPYTATEIAEIAAASNRISQKSSAIKRHHAALQGVQGRPERSLIERMDSDAFTAALRTGPDDAVLLEAAKRVDQGMLQAQDLWSLLAPGSMLGTDEIASLLRRVMVTPRGAEAVLGASGDNLDTEARELNTGAWTTAVSMAGVSAQAQAGSFDQARQAAMCALLARRVGAGAISPTAADRPIHINNANAMDELLALARAARWPAPVVQTKARERADNPLFRTSVLVDVGPFVYKSPSVVGSTERAATETAAAMALQCLRPAAAEQIDRDGALHGIDYSELLAEKPGAIESFCHRNGITTAVQWTTERASVSEYACQVILRQGQHELLGEGAGPSREQAISQAQRALTEILIPERIRHAHDHPEDHGHPMREMAPAIG